MHTVEQPHASELTTTGLQQLNEFVLGLPVQPAFGYLPAAIRQRNTHTASWRSTHDTTMGPAQLTLELDGIRGESADWLDQAPSIKVSAYMGGVIGAYIFRRLGNTVTLETDPSCNGPVDAEAFRMRMHILDRGSLLKQLVRGTRDADVVREQQQAAIHVQSPDPSSYQALAASRTMERRRDMPYILQTLSLADIKDGRPRYGFGVSISQHGHEPAIVRMNSHPQFSHTHDLTLLRRLVHKIADYALGSGIGNYQFLNADAPPRPGLILPDTASPEMQAGYNANRRMRLPALQCAPASLAARTNRHEQPV